MPSSISGARPRDLRAEPDFDVHLGFAPGAGAARGPAPGEEAAESLPAICARLSGSAFELLHRADRRAIAERFEQLPAQLADPESVFNADRHYAAYLTGAGASLLRRLARALDDHRLPASDRREQLLEVADGLEVCLAGFSQALTEAVRRLECASGGVVGAGRAMSEMLRREILEDFLRRTAGRDPSQLHPLESHFPHFLRRIEERLGIASGEPAPPDIHAVRQVWSREEIAGVKAALADGASPARSALRLAEHGLVEMRRQLREAGVDADRLRLDDPWQVAALEAACRELETGLGPASRQVLLEPAPDAEVWRVAPDPGRLAATVFGHLVAADAVSAPPGPPRVLAGWLAAQGRRVEVMCLGGVFCWAREDRDARQTRRLSMADLQVLDDFLRPSGSGGPRLALSIRQREAIAGAALCDAGAGDLAGLHPRWLVTDELARQWWRAMSGTAMEGWWRRHPARALPAESRGPLAVACAEAHDWPRFRSLLPGNAGSALEIWRHGDGSSATAGALRRGDTEALEHWLALLRRAAPTMTRHCCFAELSAKDESGCPVLVDAMRHGSPAALEIWIDAVNVLHEQRRLSGRQHARLLTGALSKVCFTPAGEALETGRADLLAVYLDAVKQAVARGQLTDEDLKDLISLAAHPTSGDDRGLTVAMASGHADVVRLWVQVLLDALRERRIGRRLWLQAMHGGHEHASAYAKAMSEGHLEAQCVFLKALRAALASRLIPVEKAARLLLPGEGEMHGPSQAVLHGHQDVLAAHLDAEAEILTPRVLNRPSVSRQHWIRAGAHAAIDVAMASGNADAVRCLLAAAARSTVRLSADQTVRTFQGDPRGLAGLKAAIVGRHGEALTAWLGGVAEARRAGRLSRKDLRRLLRGEGDGAAWESALHLAAGRSGTITECLAAGIVAMADTAEGPAHGLRSRDLLSLLGCRRGGIVAPPLAEAMRERSGTAMRALIDVMFRAWREGRLDTGHLRRLLSMRMRDGRQGMALAVHRGGVQDELAPIEYARGVVRAVRSGVVTAAEASVWLFSDLPRTPGIHPMEVWAMRAVNAAERRGTLAPADAAALRAVRAPVAAPPVPVTASEPSAAAAPPAGPAVSAAP